MPEHFLAIDRIALTLDGMSASDARLIATELPAVLEARLQSGGRQTEVQDAQLLETALHGRALVDAIAGRLADAICAQAKRGAQGSTGVQESTEQEETPWP
jgi:hypothetical protein